MIFLFDPSPYCSSYFLNLLRVEIINGRGVELGRVIRDYLNDSNYLDGDELRTVTQAHLWSLKISSLYSYLDMFLEFCDGFYNALCDDEYEVLLECLMDEEYDVKLDWVGEAFQLHTGKL